MGGPGVDPHYNGTTSEARAWGAKQAAWALSNTSYRHLTYPVLRDIDGNFVRGLGTDAVPETFVINRQGRIAAVRRYQVNSRWLDQTLPKLLAERS